MYIYIYTYSFCMYTRYHMIIYIIIIYIHNYTCLGWCPRIGLFPQYVGGWTLHCGLRRGSSCLDPLRFNLVGGFNPLKNMKVSWDDYSQYLEKYKPCSKPPTSNGVDTKNHQTKKKHQKKIPALPWRLQNFTQQKGCPTHPPIGLHSPQQIPRLLGSWAASTGDKTVPCWFSTWGMFNDVH